MLIVIFAVLHDHRHRGRDHVGGIGPDQQVDLVDTDELGVDARHVVGVALVVVIDKFDRAPQKPALGVDVLSPDLQRQQVLLAVGRDRAGERHAEADLDRIGRARRGHGRQQAGEQDCEWGERNGASCEHLADLLPPSLVTAPAGWRVSRFQQQGQV
jgi:hypothetical protein